MKEDKKEKKNILGKVIPTSDPSEEVFNPTPITLEFRYYCEKCSNTAFFTDRKIGGLNKTCQSCGQVITTKIESYLLNK